MSSLDNNLPFMFLHHPLHLLNPQTSIRPPLHNTFHTTNTLNTTSNSKRSIPFHSTLQLHPSIQLSRIRPLTRLYRSLFHPRHILKAPNHPFNLSTYFLCLLCL